MSSRGGSSVPKFTSFKKNSEPLIPTPAKDEEQEKDWQEDRRVRREGKPRDTGRHKRSKDLGRASDGRSTESEREPESKYDVIHRPAPPQPATDELFTIDKRGDPLIRRYGANDRYKVPAYRRFGAGRLLGSKSFFRIDRSGNREVFFLRGYGENGSQLSRDRKTVLAKVGRARSELVRVRPDKVQTFTGAEDFLPLKQLRKRKRTQSGSDESASNEGPSYRSIHGMSKKHENSDSDEAYGSDISTEFDLTDTNDPIKLKNIQLTARVKEQPDDIDAWVQLAEHQDIIRDLNSPEGRAATQAEIKSYADIKHSMLEKALKHSKTPEQAANLRLRMMQEGSKIWDLKIVTQRWEELLADHGANFEIWKAYMTFRQVNLSTFRYDETKQLYTDKIRATATEMAEHSSESRKMSLYDQLIVVFSRATHFIADSGYAELAVAAWQAMLELHFCRPVALANASPSLSLSGLQTFWESEVARIGDENAKGWGIFESTGGREDPPEPKLFDSSIPSSTRDPYKAWAAFERHRSQDAKIPARTMDDGTEDDPYRVIMYSDIEDLLFFIPTPSLSLVQEQLLDAFLLFCQLPPVFGSSVPIRTLLQDQVTHGGSTGFIVQEYGPELQDDAPGGIKPPIFDHYFRTMAKSLDVMFSYQWFSYMKPLPGTISSWQYTVVSNVLKHLTSTFRKTELATYYLCFESTNNTGSIKKAAKTLLKKESNNVDLYIAFARSEFTKGSQDVAMNVIPAALGLKDLTIHDRVRLCSTWAWMELENNGILQASMRLCQAAEDAAVNDTISPLQVLKVRQLLTRNRDHFVSSREPDIALIYAEALALLEYTTGNSGKEPKSGNQGDIWSVIASVTLCSESFISRGFSRHLAHEKLLQSSAHLLYYHASHGSYRPAFFRQTIASYIRLFPRNTVFLRLYAWREERLSIEDRTTVSAAESSP
ncbi:hypothetical protein TruAng_005775 [Truncatella angustata]|nr:hypothetical protein TruAng_005775 [Truncatella angustata]